MSETVHIYSMQICPFAQRTRILLAMKGVDFDLTEIDLTKPRPDWFLDLNPLGQVPVIAHRGKILNESSVINEYLEDAYPEPRVFPDDAYARGVSRILIDYGNRKFIPTMYQLLMQQDETAIANLTGEALASWRWVNDFLARYNPDGVWLFDEHGFGMAELTYAPFFMRYCLNEYYRHFELPETNAYRRVAAWRDACLAEPLVHETGMSDEAFIKLYYDYSMGYANGAPPEGREHSSFDLGVPLEQRPMPPRPAATTAARG